jgi:hypothetical protein
MAHDPSATLSAWDMFASCSAVRSSFSEVCGVFHADFQCRIAFPHSRGATFWDTALRNALVWR